MSTSLIPLDGVNESVLPIIGSELKKLETYLKKKQTEVKALDPEDAKKAAEKRLEMKRERLKSEEYIDEQIEKVMKEKEIWDNQEKGWKKFKAGMKAVFNDLEGQCSVIEKAEEERKKAELAARTQRRADICRKYEAVLTILDLETISDEVWPAVENDMKVRWEEREAERLENEKKAQEAVKRQEELKRLGAERLKTLAPLTVYVSEIAPDLDWAFLGEIEQEVFDVLLKEATEKQEEDNRARLAEQERLKAEQERLAEEKKRAQQEIEAKQRKIKIAQDRVNYLFLNYKVSKDINELMDLTDEQFKKIAEEVKEEQIAREKLVAQQQAEKRQKEAEEKARQERETEAKRLQMLPDKEKLIDFANKVKSIQVPANVVDASGPAFNTIAVAHAKYIEYIIKTAGTLG